MWKPLHDDLIELIELLILYDPLLEHKAQQIQLQRLWMLEGFISNRI